LGAFFIVDLNVFVGYNIFMITKEMIEVLKNRYSNVNPLIFARSKERAKTAGELFDILDTIPTEFPIIWSEETKKWVTTKDLFQAKTFSFKDQE
jgi:hypothetical protein